MKHILLITAFMFTTGLLFAQKPSVGAAEAALAKGELDKAKELIDGTIAAEIDKIKEKNEKSKAKGKPEDPLRASGKTLYTKAKIYREIAVSNEYSDLAEDPIKEAADTYAIVLETEKDNSLFKLYAEQEMQQFFGQVFNKAIEHYNEDDLENAMMYFEKASMVAGGDTSSLQNALQCAYTLENKEKTRQLAKQLMDLEFNKPYLYQMLATYITEEAIEIEDGLRDELSDLDFEINDMTTQVNKSENADEREKLKKQLEKLEADKEEKLQPKYKKLDEALAIVKDGRKANPDDASLLLQQINILINLKKTKEAIAAMEEALALTPDEKTLNFNLGILYEQEGEKEKAIKQYTKSIELDPENYDAHFSLGAVYYNRAAAIARDMNNTLERDKYGNFKDKAKEKTYEDQIKAEYRIGMPHFEKAHSLKPEEIQVMDLLSRMYDLLEMKAELKAMNAKIEKVEAAAGN